MALNLSEIISTGFSNLLSKFQAGFEDLKTAMASKAALETEVAELKATVARQEQEITGLKAQVAGLPDLQKAKEKAETDLTAANAKIVTLEASQKSVGERAAEITASQGVKPDVVPEAAKASVSRTDLLKQYNELAAKDSVSAGQFYAKHKKELLGD